MLRIQWCKFSLIAVQIKPGGLKSCLGLSMFLSASRWMPKGRKYARTVKSYQVMVHLFLPSCISAWHIWLKDGSFVLPVCMHVYLWICVQTSEGWRMLTIFPYHLGLIVPLRQCLSLNPRLTTPCCLDWLASQLMSFLWGYRPGQPCLVCMSLLGIWTQILMVAQQVLLHTESSSHHRWTIFHASSMASYSYYY